MFVLFGQTVYYLVVSTPRLWKVDGSDVEGFLFCVCRYKINLVSNLVDSCNFVVSRKRKDRKKEGKRREVMGSM